MSSLLLLAAGLSLSIRLPARAQGQDSARVGIHQLESEEHRWDDLKTDRAVPALGKANALVREGRIDEAVKQYRAFSQKKSPSRATFNLGLVAFNRGDYVDALRWFRASYQARRDATCLRYIRDCRRLIKDGHK